MENYGWCSNPAHGGTDHNRRSNCVRFISDQDATALLMAEARAHDRQAIAAGMAPDGGQAARYVAEHRPY
jgi:hypothetical protein